MTGIIPIVLAMTLPLIAALAALGFHKNLRGLTGLAIALGGPTALVLLKGWPGWIPSEASGWLIYLLPAAWLLALGAERFKLFWGIPLLSTGLYVLLKPMIEWHWETTMLATSWFLVYLSSAAVLVQGISKVWDGEKRRWPRIYLGVYLGVTAVSLAASGSLLLGQLAGAMALAMTPFLLKGDFALDLNILAPLAMMQTILVIIGLCYAELHPILAIALVIAVWVPILVDKAMGLTQGKQAEVPA